VNETTGACLLRRTLAAGACRAGAASAPDGRCWLPARTGQGTRSWAPGARRADVVSARAALAWRDERGWLMRVPARYDRTSGGGGGGWSWSE